MTKLRSGNASFVFNFTVARTNHMAKKFETEVVGLQYRLTASTRRLIRAHIRVNGPIECLLIREPDNTHDPNAIKVKLRSSPYKGMHIGYLPRAVSSVYANALDEMAIHVESANIMDVDPEEAIAPIVIWFTKTKPRVKSGSTSGSTKPKKKKSAKGA
jgi:hypothetical protein